MTAMDSDICPACLQNGEKRKLRVYQVNFGEAVYLCDKGSCPYPMSSNSGRSCVLSRPIEDIIIRKRKGQLLTSKTIRQKHENIKAHRASLSNGIRSQSPNSVVGSQKTISLVNKIQNAQTVVKPQLRNGSVYNGYIPGQRSQSNSPVLNGGEEIARTLIPDVDMVETGYSCDYVQWKNEDALCWLDVVLCLFVHCKTLRSKLSSLSDKDCEILTTLLKAYDQATRLMQCKRKHSFGLMNGNVPKKLRSNENRNETVIGPDNTGVDHLKSASDLMLEDLIASFDDNILGKPSPDLMLGEITLPNKEQVTVRSVPQTGAGLSHSLPPAAVFTSSCNGLSESSLLKDVQDILNESRENVWAFLHPKLHLKKGKHDSPVFAIPLLLRQPPEVQELFSMTYSFEFHCQVCGMKKRTDASKVLPTFPNVCDAFSPLHPVFLRECFSCHSPGQEMCMKYNGLPKIIMFHFVKGLTSNCLMSLDFVYGSDHYQVTGVIQYKTNPDHFVAWIRDPQRQGSNNWMECDDTEGVICHFQPDPPDIPPNEIHIVMWERTGTNDSRSVHSNDVNQVKISHYIENNIETNSNTLPLPIRSVSALRVLGSLNSVSKPVQNGSISAIVQPSVNGMSDHQKLLSVNDSVVVSSINQSYEPYSRAVTLSVSSCSSTPVVSSMVTSASSTFHQSSTTNSESLPITAVTPQSYNKIVMGKATNISSNITASNTSKPQSIVHELLGSPSKYSRDLQNNSSGISVPVKVPMTSPVTGIPVNGIRVPQNLLSLQKSPVTSPTVINPRSQTIPVPFNLQMQANNITPRHLKPGGNFNLLKKIMAPTSSQRFGMPTTSRPASPFDGTRGFPKEGTKQSVLNTTPAPVSPDAVSQEQVAMSNGGSSTLTALQTLKLLQKVQTPRRSQQSSCLKDSPFEAYTFKSARTPIVAGKPEMTHTNTLTLQVAGKLSKIKGHGSGGIMFDKRFSIKSLSSKRSKVKITPLSVSHVISSSASSVPKVDMRSRIEASNAIAAAGTPPGHNKGLPLPLLSSEIIRPTSPEDDFLGLLDLPDFTDFSPLGNINDINEQVASLNESESDILKGLYEALDIPCNLNEPLDTG